MIGTSAIAHAIAGSRQARTHDTVVWTTFLLMGLLMFSLFAGLLSGRAKAQVFRSATDAPAAWNEFAGNLRERSEAVLRSDDEVARRFQTSLERLKADGGDKPASTLTVQIWISASGQVERVAFAALSDSAANMDLKTLLMRVSAGAPPPDMLQPVRLKLSLEPRS